MEWYVKYLKCEVSTKWQKCEVCKNCRVTANCPPGLAAFGYQERAVAWLSPLWYIAIWKFPVPQHPSLFGQHVVWSMTEDLRSTLRVYYFRKNGPSDGSDDERDTHQDGCDESIEPSPVAA